MVNLYITKPLRKFMNQDVNVKIDADSYLNLYNNLLNIYPDLKNCVRDIYNTRSFDLWFLVNGKILPYEELLMPIKKDATITFVPFIAGSGDGIGGILAGVAIIAISVVLLQPEIAIGAGVYLSGSAGLTAALGTAGVITTIAGATLSLGVSLALSGIMQLIAGPGQQKNSNVNDSTIRANNETFGPLQNTTNVGTPIPLIFGHIRVPGQFIAGRVRTINHSSSQTVNLVNYL